MIWMLLKKHSRMLSQYTGEEWERRSMERQLMDIYRRQGRLEEMLKQAEDAGYTDV